ncbi:uncharacterized protein LOC114879379 [Osmia bicornis bicornis]|uniref:uncharacterized protein LOC114879379 n=1 Tax=Osmia bicornis bicornis TaxID=1437191 RepID=UPI001EAEEE07|nr:uncharacterized protein LOC114879379 [Osmia bicornis bicornis]XP_046144637.1 uncharacterized protein LOC114879379 [Osmia bicornis bicornis]XP_046144638.1 uncharacterized protein LOC114879379 [Osmia bicornis bicornis]XP_046144639.1 uncharacterized protein LOC114879379 [Osmia bicornis bicornis]
MYKTVRKGDASLQYTILPQTDQFSSSGFPQTSSKPRPRIIKYTMGTLMILIILSCVATPFLMNQNDQSLFANTVLAMGRVSHNTIARNSSRSQAKDVVHKSKSRLPLTTSSTEVYRKPDVENEMSTVLGMLKAEVQDSEDLTITDFVSNSTQHLHTSSEPTRSVRHTSTSVPSTLPPTFSTTFKTVISTPNEVTKTSASSVRKAQMPRITLKLRENETIPQMYMKAGIASYKKGNITTSVLAHGLSLEGLIFKTPEGTIKPWPQKWFFTDPSSDFQWKGSNQMPVMIYIVLAGLAAMASISIVLMFYVQRKAIRRQRQSVEEPEVEGHEEDKSTLLGSESQETEEKE